MSEEITSDEEKELLEQMGLGYPKASEKQGIYQYLKKVLSMKDNSKTAFLKDEELGLVKIPVRTNQEIALVCESCGMKGFATYFRDEAQIVLATSLSRDGFLNKIAVTQKKETETRARRKVVNKGWFKKRSETEEEL